jgi:hypothetical protein
MLLAHEEACGLITSGVLCCGAACARGVCDGEELMIISLRFCPPPLLLVVVEDMLILKLPLAIVFDPLLLPFCRALIFSLLSTDTVCCLKQDLFWIMMNPQDSCLDHYFAAASTSPPCLLSAG